MDVAQNKKITNIDDVLIKFDVFGKYYMKSFIFLALSFASSCVLSNNYVFTAMEVDYRCADERYANDSCAGLGNSSDACAEWVYDDPHSFVAEFGLACQQWKRTLIGTVHSFGALVGLLFIGPISDRLGRNKTIAIFGSASAALGIAKSFITNYWIYVSFEILEGIIGSFNSPTFLLAIELVAHEKRIVYQMMINFGYASGFLVLPLTAWSVPYWRHMLRVIYSPVLYHILFIFCMDESPRWLLSKGRKDETIAIIQKIAKSNKVDMEQINLENLSHVKVESNKFSQMLKSTIMSKILLKRLILCVYLWIACTFVNYGMQINSVSLQGNKYVNFSYLCITEVLGNLILAYLILRFKRKMPLASSYILAALLCIFQAFIPKDLPWLSVLFYMSGKLMAVMFFGIMYVYTSELFPTSTRNSIHALCSSLGRIGSITAPQTPLLMTYWHGLPSLVYGAVSLTAGLLTLSLAPNMSDEPLPDTVQQAEAIGDKETLSKADRQQSRQCNKRETKNHEHRF